MSRWTWPLALTGAILLLAPALNAAPLSGDLLPSLQVGDLSSWVLGIQEEPKPPIDVDIEIGAGSDSETRWFVNPVWLAIGGLAAVVLMVLVILAVRSSQPASTTIVHD